MGTETEKGKERKLKGKKWKLEWADQSLVKGDKGFGCVLSAVDVNWVGSSW